MGLDKLKRVMWRLRELEVDIVSFKQIEEAIMAECGTDERTIKWNMKQLRRLGWLIGIWQQRWRFKINVPDE